CVAFNADGSRCVTGGEDRSICLWNTATGELVTRFPEGHRGGVTALQFLPDEALLSAGKDNTLLVWTVGGTGGASVALPNLEHRSGDVPVIGASPDGKRVLFDEGKELHVLALPSRQSEGVIYNPGGSLNFTTMALFSPGGGDMILTSCASEARLQLWRAPT